MRHKRAFFTFEDDGNGFHGLESVPNIFRNIDTIHAIVMAQDNTLDDISIVIVCRRTGLAPEYHKRLVLGRMPMNGHLRAGAHSI